ncbi:MAG: glycosyltransferase family 2 protein [Gammaproteobacteria bacterium]|nr:MAG: glycosyltransferase family 2 protein [Gammaproteobacteria bacterium]
MAENICRPETGPPSLAGRTLSSGVLGGLCLSAIAVFIVFGMPTGTWLEAWLGLAVATLAGFVVRGLRRKAWFGSRLSLHQSLSFEGVVQTVQWLSPSLSSRAFETEFLIRETSMGRKEVTAWLRSRRLTLPVIACAAAGVISWSFGTMTVAAIFSMLAIFAILKGTQQFTALESGKENQRVHAMATMSGLAVWGIEGTLFVVATQSLLDLPQALLLYIGFTVAVESAVIPMALGVAELPAVLAIAWGGGPTALGVLLIFHASRLILLMALGLVYLPRYKLTVDDLLDTGLITRLASSQRPAEGWQFEDDGEVACDISVVIPAYNEAERLPPYLDEVVNTLRQTVDRWEIIVVDDGSTDLTREIVRDFSAIEPGVQLVCNEINLGKGGAVARGVSEARGRYILFTDADGATPASEIHKLVAALHSGVEIAIGSRRASDVAVTLRRDSIRAALGSSFYAFVNFFAVPGIRDTQCGFKAFRRDAASRLFDQLTETGWAFDVEVLYRAQLVGYAVAEVPVNWQEMEGSKLDPVRDAIRMARAIFKIRRQNAGFQRRVANHRAISDDLPIGSDRWKCTP